MYSWCIKTALTISFLSAIAFNQSSTEFQWRTIYIIPEDRGSSLSCPVNYCYQLQDALSNSSNFFDSNTTLELLPGVYNITKKVGQLVLVNVENLILRGSSPNSVNITCQSHAFFGLTVIQSNNIEVSNIQFSHCSTKIMLNLTKFSHYNKWLEKIFGYNLSFGDAVTNGTGFPAFFASFESINVTIYKTAILNSEGFGIFSLGDKSLYISSSVLAYNQINCIAFVLRGTKSTRSTFNISQSQIKFGQTKSHRIKFASGLNTFVHVNEEIHSVNLTDITIVNNRGAYGNFYMEVFCRHPMIFKMFM